MQRYAKELYYLGVWMTPEFALLVANAPHGERVDHGKGWSTMPILCQNFADEAGFLRDPNYVPMKVEHCHQLGITDDELRAYVPMPETIGSIYTPPGPLPLLLRRGAGRLREARCRRSPA